MDTSDAQVLLRLCGHLPRREKGAPAPLSLPEWSRVGAQLRQAGLSRPGELLQVEPDFWHATGLDEVDVVRLQSLLARGNEWDAEQERLAERGIRAITMADPGYPERLRARLRGQAPPVLFVAGAWDLLDHPGLAIVGSRQVDEEGAAFAAAIAERCAREGLVVVTGGAKGVDQIAMRAALERGGAVVAVPAGDLERAAAEVEARRAMENGGALLLSPFHPQSGFSVAHAMARNKLIYALAEWGLVVASAFGQGGTWAGAREALRHGWVPLFVREGTAVPDGNRELLRPAARPFPSLEALGESSLGAWLAEQVAPMAPSTILQPDTALEEPCDLFSVVWPRLAAFLITPHSSSEVAEAFHLSPAQASEWLQRARIEGRAQRLEGRPQRYQTRLTAPAHQLRLLDRSERYDAQSGGPEEDWPGRLAGWPAPGPE